MQELSEISVKEYYKLPDQSKDKISKEDADAFIRDGLAENPVLRIGSKEVSPKVESLWAMKWEDKIEMEGMIKSGDITGLIQKMYDIKETEFIKLNVFNCFASFKWIQKQLKQISDLEERELSREPSGDEMDAGVENIGRFGHLPALEAICSTFAITEKEALSLEYQSVFFRLCYLKTKADIQQNLVNNAKRNLKSGRR